MSIRLGANPIIWSNDDLRELGAETPLETCLAQARQIGFEGMELGHKFPRDPVTLAATLERFGLACVSGWYSAQLLARDARAELACLRPHLDLLKAVEVGTQARKFRTRISGEQLRRVPPRHACQPEALQCRRKCHGIPREFMP